MNQQGLIVAGSFEIKLHIFNIETGLLVEELDLQGYQANKLVSSSNLVYAASYMNILSYDLNNNNNKPNQIFSHHDGNITDIYKTSNFLISCGEDKNIKFWDYRTSQAVKTISTTSSLNSIVLLKNEKTIISCNENGSIVKYDINSPIILSKIDVCNQPIRYLTLTADGQTLIAVTQDGSIYSYKVENDKLIFDYNINLPNSIFLKVDSSPNNKYFATAASENNSRIWTINKGELKHSLISNENQEWVFDTKFSKDSSLLYTASSDGYCRIWEVENGRMIKQTSQISKCITAMTIIEN